MQIKLIISEKIKKNEKKRKKSIDSFLQDNNINICCDDNTIHFMFLKSNG